MHSCTRMHNFLFICQVFCCQYDSFPNFRTIDVSNTFCFFNYVNNVRSLIITKLTSQVDCQLTFDLLICLNLRCFWFFNFWFLFRRCSLCRFNFFDRLSRFRFSLSWNCFCRFNFFDRFDRFSFFFRFSLSWNCFSRFYFFDWFNFSWYCFSRFYFFNRLSRFRFFNWFLDRFFTIDNLFQSTSSIVSWFFNFRLCDFWSRRFHLRRSGRCDSRRFVN